jgi:ABC-type multidrug transport system fused ATPase/permease subunit
LAVTVVYYPFLYLSLELPKIIVNEAIGGGIDPPYPMTVFGHTFIVETPQIRFLLALSFTYLFLVLVNGCFKFHINVYKGRLGERLLRRLRYQLYSRMLRFPLSRFRRLGQGEIIPIVTAEVEPLGGFIGTAFADPMFYGGQLVVILSFIMIQDPALGIAAIAFYPLQMYIIPKLQRRVNELAKRRVQNVRRLSDHIGESVSGIVDVRANDTVNLELARLSARLGRIYDIRFELYQRKFFIKFLNNFIDKLTPFFFFSIGGYLVIKGELTLGALIAVLAAYKDLAAPWREMLVWYQQKEDVRIKYDQVVEQFAPPGMRGEEPEADAAAAQRKLAGDIVANVSLVDDDGGRLLDSAVISLPVAGHAAIVGDAASGKSELAMVLAGLIAPTSGKVAIGGQDLAELPLAVTGRRIGYVGANAHLQNASISDNLVYGLKRQPPPSATESPQRGAKLAESVLAGNSAQDFNADWIDYQAAGVDGPDALCGRMIETLYLVGLDRDVYQMGLRGSVDPDGQPETVEKILAARLALRERLEDPAFARLVEPFDVNRYNTNATVGENLLFGVPVDGRFDMEHLADHPYVMDVLDRAGLTDVFVEIGWRVAETMVELFADLPADHEFLQQFSFISAEDLPAFRTILGQSPDSASVSRGARRRLLSLPFLLVVSRHRLGLIDAQLQESIVAARHLFAAGLPASLDGAAAFFEEGRLNPAATIQDNMLFGKLAYGQAHSAQKVGALIDEVVDRVGLRTAVIAVGLQAPAGVGGARLSLAQRQRLAIGRALLKRPDILIVNEAAEALDRLSQAELIERLHAEGAGRGLIWVMNQVVSPQRFEQIVVMKDGKVVEQGSYDVLAGLDGSLGELLDVA